MATEQLILTSLLEEPGNVTEGEHSVPSGGSLPSLPVPQVPLVPDGSALLHRILELSHPALISINALLKYTINLSNVSAQNVESAPLRRKTISLKESFPFYSGQLAKRQRNREGTS